jgi:gluconolactonase
MIASPDNVTFHGDGLDHPESVCIGTNGELYAGGEAGQIYRIVDAGQRELASTGGFILGLTCDGAGGIIACDCAQNALFRITLEGTVQRWCDGVADRPLVNPNHGVFTADGRFLFSNSGDYWSADGDGFIGCVNPDGSTRVFHAGPFRFPNGVAIDPAGQWLYIAQSTAANIVRIPLDDPNGPIEIVCQLAAGTVPDGICCAADGSLLVGCYKPDAVFVCPPGGVAQSVVEDPTGELINRPTNIALHDGRLYIANLGGWHIASVPTELAPGPIHYPVTICRPTLHSK